MKLRDRMERGQALILIVFAIVGLIGITGLAVDGGIAFSDRRHAQNAADTAALAGALARVNVFADPSLAQGGTAVDYWKTMAGRMAEENGYFNDIVNSQVEVYSCNEADSQCEAPYAGSPDYIQVIITSHVPTFFARVLDIPQMTNRVQAIAKAKVDESGPLGNGEGIVSYAPQCTSPENFIIEGSTTVTITGGGLFSNSADPTCGFKCESNGAIVEGDITTPGGDIGLANSCLDNYDDTTYTQSTGGSPLDFPVTLEDLGVQVPSECDPDAPLGYYQNFAPGYVPAGFALPNPYPGYPTEPITVLHPGRYGQFPPPKDSPALALNDVMLMMPGTYCVSDVIRWNQPKFVLVGHNVTIFIRAGYDFAFTGGIVDIDAPDSGAYAGYLMIVEPDYGDPPLSATPDACYITGGVSNDYTGSILAPYCNCTLNGNGETAGFNAQLLCYTVKITGGGVVNITYDPDVSGEQISPPKIGISH